MSKKHENNFVLEEESSDEEELINNTEKKSKIQCEGCYYNSMNQYDTYKHDNNLDKNFC